MKVIVYQKQKKYTVNNVSIPDIGELKDVLQNDELSQMSLKDLQLYNFRITSTRGMAFEEENIQDEDVEREIEEGIIWRQETIN
jgi:hypothetical protein